MGHHDAGVGLQGATRRHREAVEISGAQLHRMLVLATRVERAQSPALAVVRDLVRAEAARLAAVGVFSFGAGVAAQA